LWWAKERELIRVAPGCKFLRVVSPDDEDLYWTLVSAPLSVDLSVSKKTLGLMWAESDCEGLVDRRRQKWETGGSFAAFSHWLWWF
jgi:hypothetical protein